MPCLCCRRRSDLATLIISIAAVPLILFPVARAQTNRAAEPPGAATPATPAAATTMHAVRVIAYGGPESLKFESVERPVPAAGEALVRVRAAGVNPVDWKIRDGMGKGLGLTPPFIPGYDVSGVIDSFGPADSAKLDAAGFKVGDEVYAYIALARGGGYAEYVSVPLSALARKPANASFEQAAAVPVAGLTAWQALFDKGELKAGQTVLIHGAAGGVGHLAVQLAKWKGATVIATASAGNHQFLKKLGADVLIDYTTEKFEEVIAARGLKVDLVLDSIGGDTQARSLPVLNKGGMLVSIVQPPDQAALQDLGVRGTVFMVQPSGEQLTQLAERIDAGDVTPHVSQTFPLAEAGKAQEASRTGRTRGKIVLKVE